MPDLQASTSSASPRARQLITQLGLQPHPEGGWYREIFRSAQLLQPADGRGSRSAITSIYFLLESGQHSRWHRVLSDEVWIYLEGLPLDLWSWDAASGSASLSVLGPVGTPAVQDETAPQSPHHVIEAGLWQAATPKTGQPDGFTLVSCMVAPGFDFLD
ncbi:MAG: cupin domain-containing protein, partial [Pseudomonadota bacterium]